MASRKEQKEKLRREREEREAAAKAAERRRRVIGYGAAGAVVAAVAVVLVVVLVAGAGDGDGGGSGGDNLLPAGFDVPEQRVTDLDEAAKAAGCELKSFKTNDNSRLHTTNPAEKLTYASKPPTSGKHFETPAEDGQYDSAPPVGRLVHSLEHGRVLIWFKKSLPRNNRGTLKALFDEDPYQMLITPDPTRMTYAVAATAWNADPQPNGTGRLLGCPRYTPAVIDAIRAFKDEHRSNGPEPVP